MSALMFLSLSGLADLARNEALSSHVTPGFQDQEQQVDLSNYLLVFGLIILISEFVIVYKKNKGWNTGSLPAL
jgi:hypothetical protein